MKKLTMLSGLPASGKSTLAREMLKNDANLGRVNRDELRKMIFNGRWSHYNEKIIVEVEKAIASVLLDHDRNIVVDDTNLSLKHRNLWAEFCSKYNSPDAEENGSTVQFQSRYVDTDIK